jgi:dihydroorotate dehydrogenase
MGAPGTTWLYKKLLRPVLFEQNPEEIHERLIHTLGWVSRQELLCDAVHAFFGAPELPVDFLGLRFPNPVGLAAGMDKEAMAVPAWAALGFGFTELGATTWLAQPGNPKPRVFRAISAEGIVNRMGFNNDGAEAVARRCADWRAKGRWPRHPVGINLGKSKLTPLEQAAEDYQKSFRVLWPHLDFFVVNVSSPNTPNLRQLQDRTALTEILQALRECQRELLAKTPGPAKPILVKVAPDLTWDALDEILELARPGLADGLVATNTTISRPATTDPRVAKVYAETGGLSGKPVRVRSTEVIHHLYRQSKGRVPIMGVGGIFNAEDAWEKITAGAALVQIYTGMVYEGAGVVHEIVTGLRAKLAEAGLKDLSQAVGLAHR